LPEAILRYQTLWVERCNEKPSEKKGSRAITDPARLSIVIIREK
jgi:hypothetical protein